MHATQALIRNAEVPEPELLSFRTSLQAPFHTEMAKFTSLQAPLHAKMAKFASLQVPFHAKWPNSFQVPFHAKMAQFTSLQVPFHSKMAKFIWPFLYGKGPEGWCVRWSIQRKSSSVFIFYLFIYLLFYDMLGFIDGICEQVELW